MGLKDKIVTNDKWKKRVLDLTIHPVKCRPQWWIRIFQRFYMKRSAHSIIYRSVRKDIVPFRKFMLGTRSVIEDYATINNAVGDIIIGNNTRIGLHNTIIGPVDIGNHVMLAQGVTVSALNHNYEDTNKNIDEQNVVVKQIIISDDVWVGANSVITSGVTLGRHVVIGAGSVVTSDVPDYSVALGVPAKVVKKYDTMKGTWVKA